MRLVGCRTDHEPRANDLPPLETAVHSLTKGLVESRHVRCPLQQCYIRSAMSDKETPPSTNQKPEVFDPQVRRKTFTLLSVLLMGITLLGLQLVLRGESLYFAPIVGNLPVGVFLGVLGILFMFVSVSQLMVAYLRGDYGQLGASTEGTRNVAGHMMNLDVEVLESSPSISRRDELEGPKVPRFIELSPGDAVVVRFRRTRARLRDEIQTLSRRSSVNLVIGVMVTMAATGVLVYLVSRDHGDFGSMRALLSFYIPRITTVILIETFAYFFLKLYRQNLEEIKYYQNELTTIDLQEVAWKEALDTGSAEAKVLVVQQMIKSDRNSNRLPEMTTKEGVELSGLLEVLQSVNKLIVSTAKAKE